VKIGQRHLIVMEPTFFRNPVMDNQELAGVLQNLSITNPNITE